jgi:rubrerythrin
MHMLKSARERAVRQELNAPLYSKDIYPILSKLRAIQAPEFMIRRLAKRVLHLAECGRIMEAFSIFPLAEGKGETVWFCRSCLHYWIAKSTKECPKCQTPLAKGHGKPY